jgi:reductive dehalogenase
MDYDLIGRSPAREAATPLGYSKIGWCTSSVATFIRELGYRAIPCGNELGLNIPMAVDAGLGEMGRHGLLITREFGPRVRIGKVFTNLPLEYDSPIDIGVQKFCEACGLCADACPSNAISTGPRTDRAHDVSNSEGLMKWPIRAMNCFDWWVKNGNGCSVCIRVCPWNKTNNILHKIVRIFAEKGIGNKAIVYLDQLLGYGQRVKGQGYGSLQDPSVIKCREE